MITHSRWAIRRPGNKSHTKLKPTRYRLRVTFERTRGQLGRALYPRPEGRGLTARTISEPPGIRDRHHLERLLAIPGMRTQSNDGMMGKRKFSIASPPAPASTCGAVTGRAKTAGFDHPVMLSWRTPQPWLPVLDTTAAHVSVPRHAQRPFQAASRAARGPPFDFGGQRFDESVVGHEDDVP
jgi:hypothetical protein